MSQSATESVGSQRWYDALFRPVDSSFLVVFRIAFGTTMLWHVCRLFSSEGVRYYFVEPPFHFTYYGFDWVRPWPGVGMYVHFLLLGAFSALMILGLFYRLSAVMVFLGFTYTFLLEKALYQNHYYLMSLISFLMIFLPAQRTFALDSLRNRSIRSRVVPAWTLWLLRVQLAIPYFYGGLAKINWDWVRGQPIRMGIEDRVHYPLLGRVFAGQYFDAEWVVLFFVWGGLLFDLLIVPGLLWKRTRVAAYLIAVFGFHLVNAFMFPIGVFPWFMIAATTVFFEPSWARRLFALSGPARPRPANPAITTDAGRRRLILGCLGVYLAVQLLVPFRHYLYPGNVSWTEEGHRFAWHMMLRSKICGLHVYARDPTTGRVGAIDPRDYLTVRQLEKLGKEPDMLVQFCRHVANDLARRGAPGVEIGVIDLVSLNGRRPQLLIDPEANLAEAERTWRSYRWVLPLHEPLRRDAWAVPGAEWMQHLQEDLPDSLRSLMGTEPQHAEPPRIESQDAS